MSGSVCSIRASWAAMLAVVAVATSGCTSAISTAYLRDTFWDLADHAAEEEPKQAADSASGEPAAEGSETAAADAERREAAIDEAVARLTKIGALDDAARGTLIETLQRTQQEDWPVVVEAFATSLAATAPALSASAEDEPDPAPAPVAVIAAAHTVAKADLDGAVVPPPAPEPLALPAEAKPVALVPAPAHADLAASLVPAAPEPAMPAEPVAVVPAPTFTVRNACFATRVQAWGVVDRFPEARFRPGQDLIVYFELDQLSSGRSAAGHTTCIDAALTLVAADGTTIRDWSFEPIAETCASQRHDYFARYVIRLPEAAAVGPCQLDVVVIDTLAGTKARTSLPLEIVAESR